MVSILINAPKLLHSEITNWLNLYSNHWFFINQNSREYFQSQSKIFNKIVYTFDDDLEIQFRLTWCNNAD